jgi:hypothetical protein
MYIVYSFSHANYIKKMEVLFSDINTYSNYEGSGSYDNKGLHCTKLHDKKKVEVTVTPFL